MQSRAVRLALVILFATAVGATAYFIATTEFRLRADRAAARDFDSRIVNATRATLDLRAAQQAYVAAGQGDDFWIAKVAAALPELSAALPALRLEATSAEAQTSLDAATAALRDFEQMDRRARDYASNDQRLLASDLIFTDGIELTGAMTRAFDAARTAESTAQDRTIAALRRSELLALASCGAFGLLVTALLAPGGRKPEPMAHLVGFHRLGETSFDIPDLSLRPERERAAPAPKAAAAAKPPVAKATPAPKPAPAPTPASPPIDLSSVASLCTELGRVADTESLPALLERTAAILDAPGIVVWLADPDGRELSPTIAHGYPPQMLDRLGVIARDAENATAAAFRTGLVQTVKSDAASNGAIAAPLVTPAGAVGVIAAEVRGRGEQQPAKLAAAAIVAAQLATLVGAPASRASKAEAAGA